MKKQDLKSGVHSVVFRNGKSGVFDGDGFLLFNSGGYTNITGYNNELEHTTEVWDVIEVKESKTLWQRPEPKEWVR